MILSMMGMMSTNPGPFIPLSLPNRNMTIRWYSAMIFIDAESNIIKNSMIIKAAYIAIFFTSS
jgi:hypothetical protein